MAAISTQVYTSLQSYWRRRGAYQKLEGGPSSENKRIARLGGGGKKKKSWKLRALRKVFIKIKVRVPSPKRLLLRLRDAYVNSMLVLAGGALPTANKSSKKVEAVWGRRIPKAREVAVKSAAGEFEMRMILHIYNTVMSQPREQLISCA